MADRDREALARAGATTLEAYTYGHFPIVAGIIVGAVGVEGVLAHAGDGAPLGLFYAAALYGGFALYLAGHLLFKQRSSHSRRRRSYHRSSGWRGWCSSWVS